MLRRDFLRLITASMLAVTDDVFAGSAHNLGGRKSLPMTKFRYLELKRDDNVFRLDVSAQRDYAVACYLLRDVRANKSSFVHPWLLHTASLLQMMTAKTNTHSPLIITSGFRTQNTNTIVGGAKHSYHMANERGFFHAMDVHMKGVPIETLFDHAMTIHQGGVGVYNNKGFVHVDVGPPRVWTDI